MKRSHKDTVKLAKAIARDLFTTNAVSPIHAESLGSFDATGRYLGGWCESAVASRIERWLTGDLPIKPTKRPTKRKAVKR